MLLTQLHFKLPTGAHLLLMECQLHQLQFQHFLLLLVLILLLGTLLQALIARYTLTSLLYTGMLSRFFFVLGDPAHSHGSFTCRLLWLQGYACSRNLDRSPVMIVLPTATHIACQSPIFSLSAFLIRQRGVHSLVNRS